MTTGLTKSTDAIQISVSSFKLRSLHFAGRPEQRDILSMIVHEIIVHQANYLLLVLFEQVDAAIEHNFETDLVRNIQSIRRELNTAFVRAH